MSRRHDLWKGMVNRCHDEKSPSYKYYGAKGIKVCERWRNSCDAFWADMGIRPEGMTLDRIDSKKDYEPSNCRWATIEEQNNNKSNVRLVTWNGITKSIGAWAKELGMSKAALHYRIMKMKLPVDVALSTPISRENRHGCFKEVK